MLNLWHYWESPLATIVNHFMRSAQLFLICLFSIDMLGRWADQQENGAVLLTGSFFKGTTAAYRIYTEATIINDAETVLCHKNELYNWERTLKYHLLLDCNCHCSVLTSLSFFTIPRYNNANSKIVLTPVPYMYFPTTHFRALHTAITCIPQNCNSHISVQWHLWQGLTRAKGQDGTLLCAPEAVPAVGEGHKGRSLNKQ